MPENQRTTQQRDTVRSSRRSAGNSESSETEKLNAQGWQRAAVDPLSSSPASLLALQRSIGNRAVGSMMQTGQAGPTAVQESAAKWLRAEPHRKGSRGPAIIDRGYQSGPASPSSPGRPEPAGYSSFPEGNGVYQELQFNNRPATRENAGPTAGRGPALYQSGPASPSSSGRPELAGYSSFPDTEEREGSREGAAGGYGVYKELQFNNQPATREGMQPAATSLKGASRPSDSPFMTLPKMSAFDDETEENGFWRGQGSPTYYQPADQPNPYRVGVQGGRLTQGGASLDTQGILPQFNKDKSHRHMFTMSGEGQFYSAEVRKGFAQHGRVHHTTMTAGQEVAAAGEMQVNQGRLEAISDSSGHYRPGAPMTYQALKNLEAQGLDTGATNVELSGKKEGERALSLSATEMMAYRPEMEAALRSAGEYRRENPLEEGDREQREGAVRDILKAPEDKIRRAHAKKDKMLQELLQKTAARRQKLDQSGTSAQQGRRDLTEFEYQEAVRGTYQASSAMSRRMTPEQAKTERKELERYWAARQMRQEQAAARQEPQSASSPQQTEEAPHYISSEEASQAAPRYISSEEAAAETAPHYVNDEGGQSASIVDRGYAAAETEVTESYQ